MNWSIFCCPLPHRGVIKARQRNAYESWMRLKPKPELIIVGDERGTDQVVKRYGATWVRDIVCNENGVPYVNAIFSAGQRAAQKNLVCYVNADIILLHLGRAVEACAGLGQCLLIGRRWDIDLTQGIRFSSTWRSELVSHVMRNGVLHKVGAVDYFAFRKGLWPDIPDFLVGRSAWDNWLVSDALRQGVPVVDVSEVVIAIHQNMPGPEYHSEQWLREHAANKRLYRETRGFASGTSKQATWQLVHRGTDLVLERR